MASARARRRRRALSIRLGLSTAALGASLLGCIPVATTGNPVRDLTGVGVAQERETGYQADLEAREHQPLIDDPVVLRFVHDLGQSLVGVLGEQPFVYRFRVIEDPSLNAFAMPAGHVYFNTGTLAEARSLDELAGVMAHEIAHVHGRHWARQVERGAVPNLLTSIAGILATAATGEPGALVMTQGLNVALQLRFQPEFEAEADQRGTVYMARAGFDPEGMAVFFERLVAEKRRLEREAVPQPELPPYFYTHPAPEERIASTRRRAESLTITGVRDPALDEAFRRAQERLARLERGRSERVRERRGSAGEAARAALEEADQRASRGDRQAALRTLRAAEEASPDDPRLPFRRAELLEEAGRPREALEAYRRTLTLDPSVALTWYRAGMLHRALGEQADAAFHLEQAERRFEPGRRLREHTRRVLERIAIPVLADAGLADGREGPESDTPAGRGRTRFSAEQARVMWWGRLAGHWRGIGAQLRVRFVDPEGRVVEETAPEELEDGALGATLPLEGGRAPGRWHVEVRLGEDVLDRRSFHVGEVGEVSGAGSGPQASASESR